MKTVKADRHGERKKRFIECLAQFLVGDQASKSVLLQMEAERPADDPILHFDRSHAGVLPRKPTQTDQATTRTPGDKAMKPLHKLVTVLVILGAISVLIGYRCEDLLSAPAATTNELLTSVKLVDRPGAGYPNPEQVALSEKRAIAGFRARLKSADNLRDMARWPTPEEFEAVLNLPENERAAALQALRERNFEASRRMHEAGREARFAIEDLEVAVGKEIAAQVLAEMEAELRAEMERALERAEP